MGEEKQQRACHGRVKEDGEHLHGRRRRAARHCRLRRWRSTREAVTNVGDPPMTAARSARSHGCRICSRPPSPTLDPPSTIADAAGDPLRTAAGFARARGRTQPPLCYRINHRRRHSVTKSTAVVANPTPPPRHAAASRGLSLSESE
uniref:Uncharacterized protein n=1 Tax=Oryza glumipatula TaxID=40148 RepID=A0A0E0BIW3_9ORYZ